MTALNKVWCDWFKLLAAILVALSHYSSIVVYVKHWSDSILLKLFAQGGFIGVAIFFFLSGYGLMESDKHKHLSIIEFGKRRLFKVYLPFLMVSVIWLPLSYGIIYGGLDGISLENIIYDVIWGGRMLFFGL